MTKMPGSANHFLIWTSNLTTIQTYDLTNPAVPVLAHTVGSSAGDWRVVAVVAGTGGNSQPDFYLAPSTVSAAADRGYPRTVLRKYAAVSPGVYSLSELAPVDFSESTISGVAAVTAYLGTYSGSATNMITGFFYNPVKKRIYFIDLATTTASH
jgi:hypothetical protein